MLVLDEENRGELLWEQPEEEVENLRKGFRLGLKLMALLVVFLGAFFLGIGALEVLFDDSYFMLMMGLPMVGLMAFFILVIFLAAKYRRPERIYENGFTEAGLLGREYFVPWRMVGGSETSAWWFTPEMSGRTLDATDIVISADEDGILLKGLGAKKKVIPPSVENFDRILECVKDQVGKGGERPAYYESFLRRKYASYTFAWLVSALVMGFIFVTLFSVVMLPWLLGQNAFSVLFGGLVLSIVLFGLLMFFVNYDSWDVPRGSYPFVVPVVAMLLLLGTFAGLVGTVGVESMDYQTDVWDHDNPGTSRLVPGDYSGEDLRLPGPLLVKGGETTRLTDCQLTFALEYPTIFGVCVERGGRLEMVNTSIRTAHSDYYYSFEVHGSLRMVNCTVDRVGGYDGHPNGEGGVEIYSDDVVIEGCTFNQPVTNCIMVVRSRPTIRDCRFLSSPDDGIEVVGGAPLVEGCRFDACAYGLVCNDGSRVVVRDCEFVSCGYGVAISGSDATVTGCTFRYSVHDGIKYTFNSDPVLEDNTFEANTNDVEHKRWLDRTVMPYSVQLDALCLPVVAIMAFGSLLPSLIYVGSQRRKQARDLGRTRSVLERPESKWEEIEDAGPVVGARGAVAAEPLEPVEPMEAIATFPSRGRLLSRAPPKVVGSPAARLMGVLPFLVVGIPYLVGFISVLLWQLEDWEAVIAGVFMASTFPVALIIVANWTPTHVGVEVYEGGVVAARPFGKGRFVPWSEFTHAEEKTYSNRPDRLKLHGEFSKVTITERLPGYSRFKDLVRERLGDKEYSGRDPWDTLEDEWRRKLWAVVGLCVITSAIFAGMYFKDGVHWMNVHPVVALLMVGLAFWLFAYPFLFAWVFNRERRERYGFDVRRYVIIFVLVGVIIFGSLPLLTYAHMPGILQDRVEALQGPEPDASWLAPGTYVGEELMMDGPILVGREERLELVDCKVEFLTSWDEPYGIYVAKGGTLVMVNTTVDAVDTAEGYYFEVRGSARIEGCNISHTARSEDSSAIDSGLEIYSDDVEVINTTFFETSSRSVSTFKCSPRIVNCSFIDSNSAGVESYGGRPVIEDCYFWSCFYMMMLDDCDATIRDCVFEECTYGITIRWCSPLIARCRFVDTNGTAVSYRDDGSEPVLEDNEFVSNGGNVRKSTMWKFTLLVIFGPLYGFSLWFVWEAYKATFRKERKPKGMDAELFMAVREAVEEQMEREGEGTRGPEEDEGDAERSDETSRTFSGQVSIQCPRCSTLNIVTSPKRPLEFRCSKCGSLLRLR